MRVGIGRRIFESLWEGGGFRGDLAEWTWLLMVNQYSGGGSYLVHWQHTIRRESMVVLHQISNKVKVLLFLYSQQYSSRISSVRNNLKSGRVSAATSRSHSSHRRLVGSCEGAVRMCSKLPP